MFYSKEPISRAGRYLNQSNVYINETLHTDPQHQCKKPVVVGYVSVTPALWM